MAFFDTVVHNNRTSSEQNRMAANHPMVVELTQMYPTMRWVNPNTFDLPCEQMSGAAIDFRM